MNKLKVLQWNVWYLEKKENLLELIKQIDADVVCLQELTNGTKFQDSVNVIEYLAEETGMHQYHKVIPNMVPNEEIGDFANGILSKHKIVDSNWSWIQEPENGGKDYDDQYRLYVETMVEVNGKEVTIGTAHVSYTHKFQDTEKRKPESDKLLSLVGDHKGSYIFTGDLNSLPGSYLVSQLEQNLVNCGPLTTEMTWTTKPFSYQGFEENDLNWRLDYVFATKDMKMVSSKTVETSYSDHLPILVTFDIE